MTDFLLELRSEEIPARMQEKAREDLARLFAAELDKAGLKAAEVVSYATPRRLALILKGLPEQTAAVSEETKGPRVGAPPQALEGFLRKTGLTADQLVERDGVLFAIVDKPGRATADVLAAAIPAVIRAFPWPKSMRWGAPSLSTESPRWVRPLQGIVALFGSDVVPCEIAGVASGAATVGHRFHHPGVITIGSADDYFEKLRACHVIVDGAERRNIIALGAKMAAQKAGLSLIEDEGLLFENAGLTEWPMPLLGRFDEAFLAVPPEVIQLTARVNQKYFVCRDAAGKLANAFVCVANIDAADGGEKIVAGNQKVLAARLSDARFFYETDLKVKLADQVGKLEKIVFHEKLGTVADKVARVAKLAEWLAAEKIVPNCDPALARRAAELAKADLVTGMVGEFPELQGLMGGYYAAAQGEDPAVAAAIRDHYKPVGQGDDVPTDPVTVAVALADKLDSITQFFGVDLKPSGSKDPFALRRSALGVLAILLDNGLRFPLLRSVSQEVLDFFADRLKVQQREAGVRHDLIDAVFALGGEDDLVRLLARVKALQAFVTTEDGANLLAGYKRAANILKKEEWEAGAVNPAPEPAEAALAAALDAAEPKATAAIEAEQFEDAMAALAILRAPIDAFFDQVTVNDADPAKRAARLGLLARMRDAVHKVADFAKIEG
ncbi:glycine--tRNA ligase subunit beta [Sphingomonas sp. ABOLD]|uniref:Glycine--tRNA ligase beta subunit n=1 Tax=Sphingomonas trueperi TaxID=53317 RepID=A0A7X6BCB0_9SPHN|nr:MULTISPECIES: glycine--tRNA ligase subunit beta [unclassified Sphingomonas]NJB96706.1 glycyl-tRNA synthetase beta chain [Sphingomonas trueperi]RSV34502.1 glycine--tRNA ligase subunit beta [Sphingomonas sp. ABOLE]RSV52037.1 glycine--tRNA ligase subunit beta [Sphingomonas sp. ABOLD]